MQQILGQWEISRSLKVWVNGKHMLCNDNFRCHLNSMFLFRSATLLAAVKRNSL